jgi:mitochondrial import inner membrane translocase subunit TIM54
LDFDIINGNHYGAMTNKVAEDIKKKRREALGLEKSHDEVLNSFLPLKGDRSPAAKARRELEGGIVVVGRHSLKEYMAGLKRGWSESLRKTDPEEELAQSLSQDIFDEPAPISQDSEIKENADTVQSPISVSPSVLSPAHSVGNNNKPHGLFGPLRQQPTQAAFPRSFAEDQPPAAIPLQPPIGLVPFTNHTGFKQIPYMIYDFFTERNRVLSGCKAGYTIVMAQSRPFTPNDLDFDLQAERYIKGSWLKLPKRITKARDEYYKELKDKIKVARELAYGEREPTRSERANPPMSEVELRNERLKKEMKWKEDLEGWEVLGGNVPWDERFDGNLRVFTEPDA